MLTFINIVNSNGFSAFSSVFSLIGDAAVLVLTVYTLHLTAFSRKLVLISPSFNYSTYHGTSITFTVMNKTLHSIPVNSIFVMKRHNGRFIHVKLGKYDPPLSVDSWKIESLGTQPFTEIYGWPIRTDDGFPDYDAMIQDAVLGVISGDSVIWLKPNKKAPLRAARTAYKNRDYDQVMVYRRMQNHKTVSAAVDCEVSVCLKDINGQNMLVSSLGISTGNGGDTLLLEKAILGYNAIEGAGHTEKSIKSSISQAFGIPDNRINVVMLSK